MSFPMDESEVLKDFDKIDAELGDEHTLRILQLLAADTPNGREGLIQLHKECREVFSKFPPPETPKKTVAKRAQSQGRLLEMKPHIAPRNSVVTQKPRLLLTKQNRPNNFRPTYQPKKIST